jgi:hypothetical protein
VVRAAKKEIFDPATRVLAYHMMIAHELIARGQEPPWFRGYYGDVRHVAESYLLPANVLQLLPLALDLCLEMPAISLKDVRRKVGAEQTRLRKVRAGVLELRSFDLLALRPECVEHELPDGSIELELGPNPNDTLVQAVDMLLERLNAIEIPHGASGRKTSFWHHAVRRLDRLVEHYNPALTHGQRNDLCHQLFDPVRERHGHRSRSRDRDADEMPRYQDILARTKRSRRKAQHAQNAPQTGRIPR